MAYKKKDETMLKRQSKISEIKLKYELLSPLLDERGKRLYAGIEAISLGYKGVTLVSEATGLDRKTVSYGSKEIIECEIIDTHKTRKNGAGRKTIIEKYPGIQDALIQLLDSTTFGNPENPLQWTIKSQRTLTNELKKQGFNVSHVTVRDVLEHLGYSTQANKKSLEGSEHIDRNAQFEFINNRVISFQKTGLPVISVDTKKKENVGNYENKGKEYRRKKNPRLVNGHDFPDKRNGSVRPYGIYDMTNNTGWINLGIDHDTAQFAVESIRRWYFKIGKEAYPTADKLLITADGGGSNGCRVRLWKTELQALATELNIELHVCHFSPGTSKWNKIEHRLFSYISSNWRGQPLVSHEVIIQLISATTTMTGLKVLCQLDTNSYETGIKISDTELATVNIERDKFHGEWNYIIKPII